MGHKDKRPSPKITKLQATILILALCVGSVYATRLALKKMRVDAGVVASRTKGNPKARIKITEYLDFQCPACAKGALLIRDALHKYPSELYLEVKYFPIASIHENTMQATSYVECAARQNKFWDYQYPLLERQKDWAKALKPKFIFQDIARQVGLDMPRLDVCLADENVTAAINRDRADGKSLGIESTPTYFLNGKMVVGHKTLIAELEKMLPGGQH